MYINGDLDDFVLRDALVDFRELANPAAHFVAINIPDDSRVALSISISIKAAVRWQSFALWLFVFLAC